MELKSGYKLTEVGIIPEDWEVKRLKQVAEIGAGINKPLSEMGSGVLYVTVQDLYDGTSIRTERLSRIKVSPSEVKEKSLVQGDIVLGKSSVKRDGIGYPSQFRGCDEPVVFSGFTYRARACQGIADATFLFYALRSEKTRRWLIDNSQASALTNINRSIADAIPVTFPSILDEQRAIATALSDVDALLGGLDRLIAKKRDLKQAAMQQLLTGQTRLPGFHGEWEVRRLGELLAYEQPTKYLVSKSEYSDANDVPVLTAGKTFILGYTNEDEGVFENLPVIIFDDFTTATKYVTFPFKAKSSAMKLLKPRNPSVNLRLVYEMMQLIEFKLSEHKRYWISEYQELELRIPDSKEQEAIMTVLSDMDAELAALEERREKTRNLKQAMMQELLIGKTRLVPAGDDHA